MSLGTSAYYTLRAVGEAVFAYGPYIAAKAVLAQYLINDAWNDTDETDGVNMPWTWSDMQPVMEVTSNKHNKNLIALSG